MAKIVAIRFKINANAMPTLIVFKVFLDNLNKWANRGCCHELK